MENYRTRTTITHESSEVLIVRRFMPPGAVGYCTACGRDVSLITLDQAVLLSGRRARALLQDIDANTIHAAETPNGRLLICRTSLEDQN